MRNYFNSTEQAHFLIMMTALVSFEHIEESSAPIKEEKKLLNKAIKCINEFSESVYERLGESFKRSISNKANLNKLQLVSRNHVTAHNNSSKMEDVIDKDYICKLLDLSADLECQGCTRTDCKNCNIYKMKSYLNYDGKSEDNDLCPFRKEKEDFSDICFDFDDLESDSK